MLGDVLAVIRWDGPQDQLLADAEDEYGALLARSLGSVLGSLESSEPSLAAEVVTRAAGADAASLRRVLLAPETSCRLLWPELGGGDERALAVFLANALELELARRSGEAPACASPGEGQLLWSALGDRCFDTDRGVWIEQPPRGGLVVDAKSPGVIHFDGAPRMGGGLRAYGDSTAESCAVCRLEAAMDALDVVSQTIARFVRQFTLVANVVVDPEIDRFSSGSMNHYVGRSIFWNAHLPFIDVGTLAEALVHEAVHSLLYMHEACSPWFPAEYRPPAEHDRIVSPWSGATLPLEPFLQACFVWYALLHFWQAAGHSSAFPEERIKAGLSTARAGFLKGPLLEQVTCARPNIAQAVLNLIGEMQQHVTGASSDS